MISRRISASETPLARERAARLAVAQDRDAVGDALHLGQAMGDVDDGRPGRGDRAHLLEQQLRSRRGVSDSVGSSSTSTFGSSASALAISTSWRSATLSSLTRADGSMSAPTDRELPACPGPARRSDGRRPRGIAKTMFSATVRSSRIERCW